MSLQKEVYHIIKPHSRSKYRVLQGYWQECAPTRRDRILYCDLHAATGKIWDKEGQLFGNGSVLIAAQSPICEQIHAIEINRVRFEQLKRCVANFPKVSIYHSDCNIVILEILASLPAGRKTFFFLDPEGLIYRKTIVPCHELHWETVERIANVPGSEILITLPLYAPLREIGHIWRNATSNRAQRATENLTAFFGTGNWMIGRKEYRRWPRIYCRDRLAQHYEYRGAIFIVNQTRAPQYYLLFLSNEAQSFAAMQQIMGREFSRVGRQLRLPFSNSESPVFTFIYED
ncbi:MAG: three-Cys-motif partner protein TcmP [Chloroflexi bacterium]|nr:three-Cys-motif partner protein TcmP [Chloroflexota bacterium]